ncbi:MAG: hypothetical protein LBQ54_04905 [Planctomycetaceae bacterium]|nr:hypothetical protein [Planctomycetaceae bacterium]
MSTPNKTGLSPSDAVKNLVTATQKNQLLWRPLRRTQTLTGACNEFTFIEFDAKHKDFTFKLKRCVTKSMKAKNRFSTWFSGSAAPPAVYDYTVEVCDKNDDLIDMLTMEDAPELAGLYADVLSQQEELRSKYAEEGVFSFFDTQPNQESSPQEKQEESVVLEE